MLFESVMLNRSRWYFSVLFALCLSTSIQAGVLVPAASTWKYFKGVTEASSPVSAWRESGFNDASWATGPAPFYYGESLAGGTVLSDMRGNYSTFFVRKNFTVSGLAGLSSASLDVRCDDGFIAWINGQQVASRNAPGNVTYNALASANASEPANFENWSVPVSVLREGNNTLAVQLFNISLAGSSDAVLDAQLLTQEKETVPPTILSVTPAPGTRTNLTQLTVNFSEPVTGVNASDLRLNDVPASTVSGSGASYTFNFPQPAYGSVLVSWSIDANITDLAVPPNPFNRTHPSATFLYELVDPTIPSVVAVHPPSGLTLNQLSEIEVLFNKIVTGVDAADLLINGEPATGLIGFGHGPYRFSFPARGDGPVEITFAPGHGIKDTNEPENPYAAAAWSYTVRSNQLPARIRINEIMAANINGVPDEEGNAEDWIELYNEEDVAVSLEGWSLTDDPAKPSQWVFPRVLVQPKGYLLVFASGKDVRDAGAPRLHTNFKLSSSGEYLGLYSADAPRRAVSELAPEYPEQRNDFSYGLTPTGEWRYFANETPNAANGTSSIVAAVAPVYFSVKRGYFNTPFELTLHCPTPGAIVRYTFDGREPSASVGTNYTGPLQINRTQTVRAAAFLPGALPSLTETHTYLYNIPFTRMRLPAISLVTATNNLYGQTGIMEVNPRNTTKHGMAWERPVSVEFIRPEDNGGFQIDAGLRIQGGNYIRERYDYRVSSPPQGKYSFRLYFRGDYGAGKLEYPLFPEIPLQAFDEIVLRAGMNDHTNPFIRDEMTRLLTADAGMVASHGTFVHLFLNGVYKGLYNPTERISDKFLRAWHGGVADWDLIAQGGEVREGTALAWNQLRSLANQNLTLRPYYEQIAARMDLENFIDYLLVNIYAGTDDWPHNNWRAAREQSPEGRFRFYAWDAEWSFGYNNSPNHNSITSQLAGSSEIATLFKRLRLSPEFRLLFADRAHKHFYNGGALTDERIRARYESLRSQVATSISGFNNTMSTSWIAQRRRYVTNHLASAQLLSSSNAPVFNQFGGRIARDFPLTMSARTGEIWFTTNGLDPRVPFTGQVHSNALRYTGPIQLASSTHVRARTLWSTNWSAVSDASFIVEQLGLPIRITELMYNPPGGEAYEYIELQNTGPNPIDLAGFHFEGINFRFPQEAAVLAPGAWLVLASSLDAAAFAVRYPGLPVFGYYTGALNNGGEMITLRDAAGNIAAQVAYDDENGWPADADGNGSSLERLNVYGDASAPANWMASTQPGGSPGTGNSLPSRHAVRLNEIFASGHPTNTAGAADWLELHNTGSASVDLSGWSISDDSNPRRFVFPTGASIPGEGFLSIWCDSATNLPGWHSGFGLSARGESLFLYDANGTRVDAISFGLQLPGYSSGRSELDGHWTLTIPTLSARNEAVTLAANLVINEVLANSATGAPDWLEIHNRDQNLPAALGGMYLSISNNYSRLPDLSFLEPAGYVQIIADESPGPDHIAFKLPASGALVVLSDAAGAELDRFSYGNSREGVSLGRLPNGDGPIQEFPASASPGLPNYLPASTGLRLNEVLANSTASGVASGPTGDWIELFNPLDQALDLGGWSLSMNNAKAGQWQFPAISVPAGAHLLVRCDELAPISTNLAGLNTGRAINEKGGGVYLFDAFGQIADYIEFGAQIPGYSIGLANGAWTLLTPTPGQTNGTPVNLGDSAQVRINEWMSAPLLGDDWIELFNPESAPVHLDGFSLTDDPSISGRTNSSLAQLTFIAPRGFLLLQADAELDKGPEHVGFSLDPFGETLRLYRNTLIVDQLALLPQIQAVSEGRIPDGSSNIVAFPNLATPGAPNAAPATDLDQDGLPDDWERAYGLNPNNPADGLLDLDGDGFSNRSEFLSGTNPADSDSLLALRWNSETSGPILLQFSAAANRSYSIFATESLTTPLWSRVADVSAGAAREVSVGIGSDLSARFYRIVTPMQP